MTYTRTRTPAANISGIYLTAFRETSPNFPKADKTVLLQDLKILVEGTPNSALMLS